MRLIPYPLPLFPKSIEIRLMHAFIKHFIFSMFIFKSDKTIIKEIGNLLFQNSRRFLICAPHHPLNPEP